MKKTLFIIGISPRSGTNYLKDLVCMHPNCSYGNANGEDYLLYQSEKLLDYINSVENNWAPRWNNSKEKLRAYIVNGITGYLSEGLSDNTSIVVTKTPKPKNLNLFNTLFPEFKLIIIIRDGRDVFESSKVTFQNKNSIRIINDWKEGAREIIEFKKVSNKNDFLVVKYEDLVHQIGPTIESICNYLEVDKSTYPFEKVDAMPVRGSSQVLDKNGKVTWLLTENMKVNKENLQFTNRYENWGIIKKTLFSLLAGRENKELGYE